MKETNIKNRLTHQTSNFQLADTRFMFFFVHLKRLFYTNQGIYYCRCLLCLRHKIKMVALKSPILVNCVLFVLLH